MNINDDILFLMDFSFKTADIISEFIINSVGSLYLKEGDYLWIESDFEASSNGDDFFSIANSNKNNDEEYLNFSIQPNSIAVHFSLIKEEIDNYPYRINGIGDIGSKIEKINFSEYSASPEKDIDVFFKDEVFKGGFCSITVAAVGQASLSVVRNCRDSSSVLFDYGYPIGYNKKTYPTSRTPIKRLNCDAKFLIISHWDSDHWQMIFREKLPKNVKAISPVPPPKPYQLKGVKYYISNHHLVKVPPLWKGVKTKGLDLILGSGSSINDTGIVANVKTNYSHCPCVYHHSYFHRHFFNWIATHCKKSTSNFLIPGDADYGFIDWVVNGTHVFDGLIMTHHGGKLVSSGVVAQIACSKL